MRRHRDPLNHGRPGDSDSNFVFLLAIFLIILLVAAGAGAFLFLMPVRVVTAPPGPVAATVTGGAVDTPTRVVSEAEFAKASQVNPSPGNWPQFRGPVRSDISPDTGLLKSWPKEGPRLLWTFANAGIGYSGPALVDNSLFTMGARDGTELVYALDVRTGKEIWSAPIGPLFNNNYGDGPRGTPTVDGDLLYALGGQGNLVCVETATGKEHWRKSMTGDLKGQMMSGWGYTESPLVDGPLLVCTPGGAAGTFAALDKRTGDVAWRSQGLTERAAYSSIVVAEVGLRQYINMTNQGVAAVAAKDGHFLWKSPLGANGMAVIPTPVVQNDCVYVTAGYGAGCGLIHLVPDNGGVRADTVYSNKNMLNHHGGVLLYQNHIYGYSDSQGWLCQDFQTGKVVWSERGKLGKGSITCAYGKLYLYSEQEGTVVLIDVSPQGWQEHGRFTIPQHTKLNRKLGHIWTHPVVAGCRLFLRDQDLIFCFDIKENGKS
jgi:outer membrane protein assembly factor BamB